MTRGNDPRRIHVGAKVVGKVDLSNHRSIVVDHAWLRDEDYSGLRGYEFCSIGSHFERCRFIGSQFGSVSFGAGIDRSEYVDCTFDGARLEMGPGGTARFVRCSFQNVDIHDWFCFEVDLIDCVFSGRLHGCVFNGAVRPEKRSRLGRDRNEIHGNDFAGAEFVGVDFRTGVDLSLQRLPSGPHYLYLPDAATALARARTSVESWKDADWRKDALLSINILEETVAEGQRQLLLRTDERFRNTQTPPEAVDALFALLRGVQA